MDERHEQRQEERIRELRAATATAARAAAAGRPPRDDAPRPGDLFVFSATADHDVEWLLTAAHPQRADRVRLVAADGAPWVGSADVEVPADETAAPLVLRCRHRLWWHRDDLPASGRSGRLSTAVAAAAEARCRALDANGEETVLLAASPLQQETDEDPEYRDRDAELAAARGALAAAAEARAQQRETARFRRRGPLSSIPVLRAAAAVLLVALAATGWWASTLARRLADRTGSSLRPIVETVDLERQRGPRQALRFAGPREVLRLVGNRLEGGSSYHAEIDDGSGHAVLAADFHLDESQDLALTLDREDFPPGRYELRISSVPPTAGGPLYELTLDVLPP